MQTPTSLVALAEMHPELEWREIVAATIAVLEEGMKSWTWLRVAAEQIIWSMPPTIC